MLWRFTVFIKDLPQFSDEQFDRLAEAGCSDGTLSGSGGVAWIGFDREANSLHAAISSACEDIRSTGLDVDHVQIDEQELTCVELAQWQTA